MDSLISEQNQTLAITRSKSAMQKTQIQNNHSNDTTNQIDSHHHFEISEHKDISFDSKNVDHIFFLFETRNCELKRKLEYRLKSNIDIPSDIVPHLPYNLNENITIILMPQIRPENERIMKFKILLNIISQICETNNYSEIAINIDLKHPKIYFEFKFTLQEIFKPKNIKSTSI